MRIMTTSISSHWFISIVGVVLFGSAQARDGDTSSPRWALGGFYASVVQPGIIRPGDPISLLDQVV